MSSELEPSFTDKVGMLKERYFPFVERSEIVEATYEIPNLGPWDMNFQGMPKFFKIGGIAFLGGLYVLGIYAAGRWGLLTGMLYERLFAVAIAVGLFVVAMLMWIFISLNWGTFSRYKRVIDYIWRYLDGRSVRKGEFRVERIVQIWPVSSERLERQAKRLEEELYQDRIADELQLLALPHVGPKTEKLLIVAGFDTVVKVARAKNDDLIQIKGITKDNADEMIASARGLITSIQKKKQDLDDDVLEQKAAEAIEDLTELEKLSSTYRLDRMISQIRGLKSTPDERDPVREAIDLKLEFIRIVRSLDSKFTYSIMECAGGLYILVISRFSLTGGDDADRQGGFVEFRDHSLIQRTYVYQGINEHGTWGVFTHLADYKYIEVPSTRYLLAGKEEKIKFAPICFLNYCDGQAELDDEQIRKVRWTPDGQDILQAELVYGASVAEKCLENIKLLTATVSRLKESIKTIWRDATDWAKGVIAKAVEKILLEEKWRKEAGLKTWLVSLLSKSSVKYLAYLMALFGLYIIFAFALHTVWNINWWPWMNPADGIPSKPDPYNP